MKKTLFIILCTFPLFTFAQSGKKNFFEGGILLGLNADQVDGDKLFGYHKLALNAGVVGGFPIYSRNFFINFELLYSVKGSRSTPGEVNQNLNENYELTLRYADVPVYLQYRDKDGKVRVGLGMSYGRLFSAKEIIDYKDHENAISTFEKRDVCWLADIQYFVSPHFGFDFRYSYSLLFIRNFPSWTYNGLSILNPHYGDNEFNHYLTFRAIYIF